MRAMPENLSEDGRRLAGNFFSLSAMQGAGYLLYLATLPYLVRVLGADRFGLVMFAQSLIQYFVLLTDYGFSYSATREISIHRGDRRKVDEIFSSVILIKTAIMLLSFAAMCAVVFGFDKFRGDRWVYLFTFGMVCGNVLLPAWLFQGMEKIKHLAFFNVLARLVFSISVFIFIRKSGDYIYVPLFNSLGLIISGALSMVVAFRNIGIRFRIPAIGQIKFQFREGWHIFISSIAASVFNASDTFILGLLTGNETVGYYSAGLKISRILQRLFEPFFQTIYPYVSKKASESRQAAILFMRRTIIIVGAPVFLLSCLMFLLAPEISNIVLGSAFKGSIPVIRTLAFLPFVSLLGNFFGTQTMLNFGYQKEFSRILIAAGILNIVLVISLVAPFRQTGMSFALLITETFIAFATFIFLQKKNIRLVRLRNFTMEAERE